MDRFQSVFKLYFIYFLSIANGCFSFYLTDPYSVLIGASGGVYGLFGAHIANYFYNGDRMFHFEILTTRIFYTFFLLCDIIPFFLVRAKKVAYQVHYFCTLFGFLTGLTIFKERRLTSFKKYIRLGSKFSSGIYGPMLFSRDLNLLIAIQWILLNGVQITHLYRW